MTTYNIKIQTDGSGSPVWSTYSFGFGSSPYVMGSTILQAGDQVRIYNTDPIYSASIQGFNSSVFTNSSNITIASEGSATKTVRSDTPTTTDSVVGILNNRVDTVTFSISGTSSDTTPTAFSLGPNQTNQPRSSLVYSSVVTVQSVDAGVSVTTSNALVRKNGAGSWLSSTTAQNGDTLQLRGTTSSNYTTTLTHGITVGTYSTSFNSTTESPDTTPDPFTLTSPTGVTPDSFYYQPAKTISGMNTSASISTNNCQIQINNFNDWYSSGTISNGNTLRVRALAGSSTGQTTSHSVTIGTRTESFTITTATNLDSYQVIPMPNNQGAPISITTLIAFFGGAPSASRPLSLSGYVKGGDYVPNISENQMSTAAPLQMSDFVGAATAFFLSQFPQDKFLQTDTSIGSGSKTASISWNSTDDWAFGFGEAMSSNTEFRFELEEDQGYDTGLTFSRGSSSFNLNNDTVSVTATVAQNQVKEYRGVVKMFARPAFAPSTVIEKNITYTLSFYNN